MPSPRSSDLAGRNAPARNYAALTKWAQEWFGPTDALTKLLSDANRIWIKPLADAALAPHGAIVSNDWGSIEPSIIADLMACFCARSLPFIEDAILAALAHVAKIQDVFFSEIPENDRRAANGARFRAMVAGPGGQPIPAGKVTAQGYAVPELQRMLLPGKGRPIIAAISGAMVGDRRRAAAAFP